MKLVKLVKVQWKDEYGLEVTYVVEKYMYIRYPKLCVLLYDFEDEII